MKAHRKRLVNSSAACPAEDKTVRPQCIEGPREDGPWWCLYWSAKRVDFRTATAGVCRLEHDERSWDGQPRWRGPDRQRSEVRHVPARACPGECARLWARGLTSCLLAMPRRRPTFFVASRVIVRDGEWIAPQQDVHDRILLATEGPSADQLVVNIADLRATDWSRLR